jgi:hypothetical protein
MHDKFSTGNKHPKLLLLETKKESSNILFIKLNDAVIQLNTRSPFCPNKYKHQELFNQLP